jgi:hypothetical protein
VRLEERAAPKIIEPTDAILRLPATCVCGSDLWPYRGVDLVAEPTPMGHEYCGIVEEVIAYYAPWGNIAIYYKDFGYSAGLIKLATIDSGVEVFRRSGAFPVLIEREVPR